MDNLEVALDIKKWSRKSNQKTNRRTECKLKDSE